jgi:hypothetical protein
LLEKVVAVGGLAFICATCIDHIVPQPVIVHRSAAGQHHKRLLDIAVGLDGKFAQSAVDSPADNLWRRSLRIASRSPDFRAHHRRARPCSRQGHC